MKRHLDYHSFDYACTTGANANTGTGWLITSVVELHLYLTVLYKSRQMRRHRAEHKLVNVSNRLTQTQDIATVMARHSTTYFAM